MNLDAPRLQFVPKAERERLRAEREQKLSENILKREDEMVKKRIEFLRMADKRSSRKIEQSVPAIETIPNGYEKDELNQIRDYYLGTKKEAKKVLKPSEKFHTVFHFEWDESDDTTKTDVNPLYMKRHESKLLLERRFRGSVDIVGQKGRSDYKDLAKYRNDDECDVDYHSSFKKKKRNADKHWREKCRDEMNDRDWMIFREDYSICVKGGRIPPPMRSWDESKLPKELLEAVKVAGYNKPTPIQMQAIPIALEMRDLIGIAETGSGKTAAFVLPMLAYVKSLPLLDDETGQDGPYSLVLAPSRELAIQIYDETRKFAAYCECRAIVIVGGRSVESQAFELRRGTEIIIGTPGRIKDCLDRAYIVLNQCNYVILDEADRMVDMGFEEVVNDILDKIPSTNLKAEDEDTAYEQELMSKAGHRRYRITQMFSATMSIDRLMKKYLRAPAFVSIGDVGVGKKSIEQVLEFVTEGKKKVRLDALLSTTKSPIMIFVNQKKQADALAKTISNMNYSAISLHGGKLQENREIALESFKAGRVDILVATDVAGRGIDVEGVNTVINYDMPKDIESYIHRIGRTGRAGKKGLAISFVTEDDSHLFYDLKQQLISSGNVVPNELSRHPASKQKQNKAF
ncbi:DEAD-box ATP-dependent RNA helicase [Babesia microti strain RI]|uniref:RNA helicase n=1 Tax=Babesia microti (strain RI) TaxID=1133968 RepID=A0A1N6LY83_BABMR|nr:DEAD-box ATP-dependent RNA helicase [Babesia microti strain RI]SIO73833.1 DEAD-box ATP-dependent RNA helicase [Babesia microti strain RI]|eukprot:XP_021337888.1 DEAD-box ATP-dependent RNA helicase [Babesia microti strain RI]